MSPPLFGAGRRIGPIGFCLIQNVTQTLKERSQKNFYLFRVVTQTLIGFTNGVSIAKRTTPVVFSLIQNVDCTFFYK